MYDVVIRGGTVVDGTGSAPVTADVAITDGRIAAVGKLFERGREEIDADGAIVTPGFVDIHTHYDGQATWDDQLAPSFWHGVTTVLMGNCGVGFAPARPDRHDWLIEIMEGVEGIPGAALAEGLRWNWESFPDYLDALGARSFSMDVMTQLPHAPLRGYVMDDRVGDGSDPTEADIAEIGRLTREALEAGAFGVSTSRTVMHRTLTGEEVPGTYAKQRELQVIVAEIAASGRGVLQVIPRGVAGEDPAGLRADMAWMAETAIGTRVPISFLCPQNNSEPDYWREQLAVVDKAHAEGGMLIPQVYGRMVGMVIGLESGFDHPLMQSPGFAALKTLAPDERVRRLTGDAGLRARIVEESRNAGMTLGGTEGSDAEVFTRPWRYIFRLGGLADYEPRAEESIEAIAARQGRPPSAVALDALLERDGRGLLFYAVTGYASGDLAPHHTMLAHPLSVLGAADGGAHVSIVCDGGMPTFMLAHWARDRTRGPRFSLEYMVKKQTSETAALYGLNDRGRIAPGLRADINVIDFGALDVDEAAMIYDLPTDAGRLMQHGTGYLHTLVAGQTVRHGAEDTGRRPGRLLRSTPWY